MLIRLFRIFRFILLLFLGISVSVVLLLRWVNPPTSAFMLAHTIHNLLDGNRNSIAYQWVDLEKVSPQLQLAVVAAEDQKFPIHHGFDIDSIWSAVQSNSSGGNIRGASTISQQVAKNLFLWSGRSYFRKGLEAYFTLLIETLWSKERILEVYVNVAELGDGLYGAEAAANAYFNKPASRLSAVEASLLAAVLPNPRRYRVEQPSQWVLERSQWIRRQMNNLGTNYIRFE